MRALAQRAVWATEEAGSTGWPAWGAWRRTESFAPPLPDAVLAPLALCTDNAAMIASAARYAARSRIPGTLRSMPTRRVPRREPCQVGPLAVVAAAATIVLVAVGAGETAVDREPAGAATWRGLVADVRTRVALGQRVIVLLSAPR